MYKIVLADGTVLDNLELNGNNFISDIIIEDAIFENNLSTVSIFKDETETVYKNMKLIQNKVHNNQSWFILAEKTEEDILKENIEIIRQRQAGVILKLALNNVN